MNQTFVRDLLLRNPVIPLLRLQRLADALPLVDSLQEGGMHAVEIWFPHPGSMALLDALREHCNDITVGAGGIRNAAEVKQARALGAHYISSPGLSPTVLQACAKQRMPCLPGISTTSELLFAREMGLQWLIVYPANLPGQRPLVSHWQCVAPEMRFVAQGGLTQAEASAWMDMPHVDGLYAEWLSDDEDLQRRQWKVIVEKARRASVMGNLRTVTAAATAAVAPSTMAAATLGTSTGTATGSTVETNSGPGDTNRAA